MGLVRVRVRVRVMVKVRVKVRFRVQKEWYVSHINREPSLSMVMTSL